MVSFLEQAQELLPQLVQWRRHIHQYPELSFEEHDTQRYILEELATMGLTPKAMGGTGVVVDIGQGPRTVAIRADIDALPLTEESDVPFASRTPGVMHACGHDGHTAILLGVAKVLVAQNSSLPGRIRLMFQPAEEQIPGGAQLLIAEGVLDEVDRVLGLHLSSDLNTGLAGAVIGAQTANADRFTITIEGRGGHGSQPELSVDPVVIAAEMVLALQTIVSRNISPRHPAVLTIGTIQSGSNFNIIAPRATLTGTVRTFSQADRHLIQQRMQALTENLASAHEASSHLDYQEGYPSVDNTLLETELTYEVIRTVLGPGGLHPITPLMAGEDFSYYQTICPGTFFMLGCGNVAVGARFPHHHPQFTLDENALPLGTAILVETALEFLLINEHHVATTGGGQKGHED